MTAEPTPATETPASTSTALAVITEQDQAAADRAAHSAALAVLVAGWTAEVDEESDRRVEGYAQWEADRKLEISAHITAEQQAVASHRTPECAAALDEMRATIPAIRPALCDGVHFTCARHKAVAA